VSLAKSLGVKFEFNSTVEKLVMNQTRVEGLQVNGSFVPFDYVIAGADYHHVEQQLLPPSFRRYTKKYWNSRTLAPSCLMFYLGLNKKVKGLLHHTLIFNENFKRHAREI